MPSLAHFGGSQRAGLPTVVFLLGAQSASSLRGVEFPSSTEFCEKLRLRGSYGGFPAYRFRKVRSILDETWISRWPLEVLNTILSISPPRSRLSSLKCESLWVRKRPQAALLRWLPEASRRQFGNFSERTIFMYGFYFHFNNLRLNKSQNINLSSAEHVVV